MEPTIIYLTGWPGVGKLTIGQELKDTLGAKLIDNHTINNPGNCLYKGLSEDASRISSQVRDIIFDEVENYKDPSMSFIFTNLLVDDSGDIALLERVKTIANNRNCNFVFVQLECDTEEHNKRMTSVARKKMYKLTDQDALQKLRQEYTLIAPEGWPVIKVDVTNSTPEESCATIISEINNLEQSRKPVGAQR